MKKECNHDLNSSHTTLQLLNFKAMSYPAKYYTVCSCCEETVEFIKKEERFIPVSKEVEEYVDNSVDL